MLPKYRLTALAFIILIFTALNTNAGVLITYKVGDFEYEAYFVAPENKDSPLILLVHDWDGLTDYEIKRANMLAEQGYTVVAADLFGKGVRPKEVKDKKQHTGELYKDREKMRALLNGAMNLAKAKGANLDRAVAVGYCFGGAAVLELARSGAEMKGFVSFHGGLTTPENQNYDSVKGDILVLHGTADSIIPMSDFANLANSLEAANVPHEMISYSGAPHAFTVFGSERYKQDADEKSWNRFLSFLNEMGL
ncbi:MAG: dienelactone hydrolase family protein [Pseudomonadota bacterium]